MNDNDVKIVFSDIDGTLLNSKGEVTPLTLEAIKLLQEKGIPFVLSSSRGPMAIKPIMQRYDFNCPMVSYGGALIVDDDGTVLYESGMEKEDVRPLIEFLDTLPLAWNIYTKDTWYVKDVHDERVKIEADYVRATPHVGNVDSLDDGPVVCKVLCMCVPGTILDCEKAIRERFPDISMAKSSDVLIEIMKSGINKAESVKRYCNIKNISIKDSMAFGDNYNDLEMLSIVGHPVVMGNAPQPIKDKFDNITDTNNNDGIRKALEEFKII